jgi:predicted small metal-binding protein
MNKVINCPCGYLVHAVTVDSLITRAQEHAKQAHGFELTREQAASMVQPA